MHILNLITFHYPKVQNLRLIRMFAKCGKDINRKERKLKSIQPSPMKSCSKIVIESMYFADNLFYNVFPFPCILIDNFNLLLYHLLR